VRSLASDFAYKGISVELPINPTPAQVLVWSLWRSPDPRLGEELIAHLRGAGADASSSGEQLGAWLAAFPGADPERRAAVVDAIGSAARRLTLDSDEPPTDTAAAEAWRALVVAADRLHGSGAVALGRLPFVSGELLALLAEEAREQWPASSEPGRRTTAPAGDVLAALAVSRKLREAVATALGAAATPTYDALYEYDPPGSRVRTHVDARDYEIVVHLLVEQTTAAGAPSSSELVAHLSDAGAPTRLTVRPGEAVVLRGRGTLHAWRPLGPDERRTLTAIGFAPVR
jgi:hypothetical protein